MSQIASKVRFEKRGCVDGGNADGHYYWVSRDYTCSYMGTYVSLAPMPVLWDHVWCQWIHWESMLTCTLLTEPLRAPGYAYSQYRPLTTKRTFN